MGKAGTTRYRTAPARPAVRYRRARTALGALLIVLLLAACSDGEDPSAATEDASAPPVTTPEALAVDDVEPPAEGWARVVVGTELDATLEITTCVRDLAAEPDGQVPSEQLVVEAHGLADGAPLTLDARRYRSHGASPTITDTVRIVHGPSDAPTSVLEAQRFELDGVVTDPRDPEADDPLFRIGAGRVEVRGIFAAPGAFASDGGLVEGLVSISCAG